MNELQGNEYNLQVKMVAEHSNITYHAREREFFRRHRSISNTYVILRRYHFVIFFYAIDTTKNAEKA